MLLPGLAAVEIQYAADDFAVICFGGVIAFCFQDISTQQLPLGSEGRIDAFPPFRVREQGNGAGKTFTPGSACHFPCFVFRCKAKLVQGRVEQGRVYDLVECQ